MYLYPYHVRPPKVFVPFLFLINSCGSDNMKSVSMHVEKKIKTPTFPPNVRKTVGRECPSEGLLTCTQKVGSFF